MPSYAALASAEGPDGLFATLESSRLIIRCAETRLLLRNIDLDPKLVSSVRHLRWFRPSPNENRCERLLLATTENVYVYEVQNQRWTATVKKICGDGNSIAEVDFGADKDEIIAYSGHKMKATFCSLEDGSIVEIRDPKNPAARNHSLRQPSGHLAILSKASIKDTLSVLEPDRKTLVYSMPLPTLDAQGVKWSPDGKWLAVWDTGAMGSSLFIYTAAGQLFKKLSGGAGGVDLGYGIHKVEWDRAGRYLAVAANEGKVILLSTRTFQPMIALEYPEVIASAHASLHEEQIASDGTHAYGSAQQPASPPANSSALGFAHFSIAPSADLLACVLAKMPTTVWIHSIHPNPQLIAVLIHHGNIRQIIWHPHVRGLLLIHCSPAAAANSDQQPGAPRQTVRGEPLIYLWGYDMAEPIVIPVYVPDRSAITRIGWLNSAIKTQAVISTASTCNLISVLDPGVDVDDEGDFLTPKPAPRTKPPPNISATPAPMLGYISETPMTGRTNASTFSPIKMDTAQLTKTLGFQFTSLGDTDTDDTFDFKKPLRARAP